MIAAKLDKRARLGALAADLKSGSLEPADREQLASALARVAAGADANTALGVARHRGQRLWSTSQAISERDRLLRQAAAQFLPDISMSEQARRLHLELLRYSTSAWRRECSMEQCPGRHLGRLNELLWRTLKQTDRVPAWRTVREILAAR